MKEYLVSFYSSRRFYLWDDISCISNVPSCTNIKLTWIRYYYPRRKYVNLECVNRFIIEYPNIFTVEWQTFTFRDFTFGEKSVQFRTDTYRHYRYTYIYSAQLHLANINWLNSDARLSPLHRTYIHRNHSRIHQGCRVFHSWCTYLKQEKERKLVINSFGVHANARC